MYRPVTKDISHVEISLTRAMLSEIGNDSEMHLVKRNASPIDIYFVFSGKTEETCHLVYSYWYSDNAIILLIYFLQKCNVLYHISIISGKGFDNFYRKTIFLPTVLSNWQKIMRLSWRNQFISFNILLKWFHCCTKLTWCFGDYYSRKRWLQ